MKRYHINPETGRPNVCRAKEESSCKFYKEDNEHYDSKEEAQVAYEKMQHEKIMLKSRMDSSRINEDNALNHLDRITRSLSADLGENRSFNIYSYSVDRFRELVDDKKMTERDLVESVEKIDHIAKITNNSPFSVETLNDLKKIHSDLVNKNILYGSEEKEVIANLADTAIKQWAYNNNKFDYSTLPQRDEVRGLINLDEAIYENYKHEESYYNGRHEGNEPINKEILNDVINYSVAHDDLSVEIPGYDSNEYSNKYVMDSRDYIRNEIHGRNSDYMRTVFPHKDLKRKLEELNIENVSVSPLNNGREVGLIYTTLTPTGETRSFAVYEHRNNDGIVINGKTNLKPGELPYVADSDHSFLAEYNAEDRTQVADTLAYFLKSSQKGTLESDTYLANNAPRIDWGARLSQQFPGFKEFAEKQGFQINDKKKTDDEILNDLDFTLDFDND